MQGIFQKENADKARKYRLYRHLPTYEKIIRNLVSFYSTNVSYDTVVNDATDIITSFQEKDELDLSALKYCDYKLYDENSDSIFGIELTKADTEDDKTLILPFEDCIFRMVPQEEDWEPTKEKNRLYCEFIIHSKPCQEN